jgi:hypothetical protein
MTKICLRLQIMKLLITQSPPASVINGESGECSRYSDQITGRKTAEPCSIQGKGKYFSLIQNVQTDSGVHLGSY